MKVRKFMSTLAMIRREGDEDYFLDKMLEHVLTQDVEWVLCADIRFPNEADYFINNGGLIIQFALLPEMLEVHAEATQGDAKYKPALVAIDPIETALDQYDRFSLETDIYQFGADWFVDEIEYLVEPCDLR